MVLNAQQNAELKKLGLDPASIDWTKIIQIIGLLISLFGGQPAPVKAAIKSATGCSDACADLMHEAIGHNLAAAQKCCQCCCPPVP